MGDESQTDAVLYVVILSVIHCARVMSGGRQSGLSVRWAANVSARMCNVEEVIHHVVKHRSCCVHGRVLARSR